MGMMDQGPSQGGGGQKRDGGGGGRFNLKDYITVQERINEFWTKYPDGSILPSLQSPPEDFTQARYKAEIRKDRLSSTPDAVGWAFELVGPKGPNSTSHEENCETSAIGRALANMGFATSASTRASREEMAKVQRMEEASQMPESIAEDMLPKPGAKLASSKQTNWIKGLWKGLGYVQPDGHHDEGSLTNYCIQYWGAPLDKMTTEQASQLLDNLQAAKDQREEDLAKEPTPTVDEDGVILATAPF